MYVTILFHKIEHYTIWYMIYSWKIKLNLTKLSTVPIWDIHLAPSRTFGVFPNSQALPEMRYPDEWMHAKNELFSNQFNHFNLNYVHAQSKWVKFSVSCYMLYYLTIDVQMGGNETREDTPTIYCLSDNIVTKLTI